MPADPRAAVDALKAALDRHLDACAARTGESDPAVQQTYDALREAALDYDDALFDAYEEVTPFEVSEPTPPGVGAVGDGVPLRLGLFVRRDYAVRDPDGLLAAGRAAAEASWPDEAGPQPADEVTSAGRAIYELLNAQGVDGLDELAEDAGLEPVGGTLWVLAEHPADESLYESPFDDVDPERLLYRLDEVFEG